MRKQERRAYICLLLALVLFIGVCVFGARFVKEGGEWASFYGNSQIYTDGMINRRKMMNWLFVFVILCLLLFGFIGYNSECILSANGFFSVFELYCSSAFEHCNYELNVTSFGAGVIFPAQLGDCRL